YARQFHLVTLTKMHLASVQNQPRHASRSRRLSIGSNIKVSTEQLVIVTAHPEFAPASVIELKQLDKRLTRIEELAPGVTLCGTPDVTALMRLAARERPIFVRHLAPVQTIANLSNTAEDLAELATAIADLPGLALLERGTHFAIQSRLAQTEESQGGRPYSSGQINQALAEMLAEETGAIESI